MDKTDNELESAPEVYYIPHNFEDAGGVLGGKIKTRNAIEAGAIVGPIAYFEANHLHFGLQWDLMIGMVTIIPLAALCIFGIHGESLTQILFAYIRFKRHRRILHYDAFSGGNHDDQAANQKITLDSLMDSIASDGLKKTFQKFKNVNAQVTGAEYSDAAEETDIHATSGEEEQDGVNTPSRWNRRRPGKSEEPEANKKMRQENKFLSSAKREKLLEKLELGKDEEE